MLRKIPKPVLVLGLVSFMTDVASEMIYPLLPVFLGQILSASTVALGVIEGVAESTSAFLKLFSGVLTDRLNSKKPMIVAGYSIAALSRPLIGFARIWPVVMFLRFSDRIGKGIRTSPRDALIADATEPRYLGAAYGFHRAMDHAGSVVGPLIAAFLISSFSLPMRSVFKLSLIPATIGVIILVVFLTEPQGKSRSQSKGASSHFNLVEDWKKLGSSVRFFIFVLLIFTLGNSTDAFLLLRLSNIGVSTSGILTLWSLHHVIKMMSSYWLGNLTDKLGPRPMIIAGWIFYAGIYLAFGLTSTSNVMIPVFLLYGIYYGATEPAERAWLAKLAPPAQRGTAFGYYHFTVGLGALPASLIFGWIWKEWGSAFAFLFGSGLALLAACLLGGMTRASSFRNGSFS
jgi:MFS family permease